MAMLNAESRYSTKSSISPGGDNSPAMIFLHSSAVNGWRSAWCLSVSNAVVFINIMLSLLLAVL